MSKKNHNPGPVPAGNRPHGGPTYQPGKDDEEQPEQADPNGGANFQDQDPKRRLGGYGGAGEHPIQQPGALNDGDRRG